MAVCWNFVNPFLFEPPAALFVSHAVLAWQQGSQWPVPSIRYIAQGPVVETIINVAEKEKADLIAIASHGRTGLSRVFYGSVASGLLHSIDRPLLLVRSRHYEE